MWELAHFTDVSDLKDDGEVLTRPLAVCSGVTSAKWRHQAAFAVSVLRAKRSVLQFW